MNRVIAVFPSGRILDRTLLNEMRVRQHAEEFPTIIYMSYEKENVK